MIRYIAPTLTFLLGLGIGVAATYLPTREKWFDLGRSTGEIGGRGAVLRDLCALAETGLPATGPDYALDVKSERLELYRDGDGTVRLYCSASQGRADP